MKQVPVGCDHKVQESRLINELIWHVFLLIRPVLRIKISYMVHLSVFNYNKHFYIQMSKKNIQNVGTKITIKSVNK
jgi:hypothetical protein